MARSTAVADVRFGLDYDGPPIAIPSGALLDGLNFRVRRHMLTNDKVGYLRASWPRLNGPVMRIDTYKSRSGLQKTVFCTFTDIYQATSDTTVAFITPIYSVGTVDVTNGNPAVVNKNTGTPNWQTTGIKAGDQIYFGNAAQTDPTATWYTVATVNTENQITLTTSVAGTPLTNQAYTIRRVFTGNSHNIWDGAMWIDTGGATDYLYLTNGVDKIVRWDGSVPATYSAATFLAKAITIYSNMLIFGGLTQSGNNLPGDMINSTPGNPENTTSGLASQFNVHDTVDPIMHMQPIGDNLAVYSGPDPGNVVIAQFVGDPLVFVFRKAVSNLGPIAARVVADQGDYHEFLGVDGAYIFDGSGLKSEGSQVWQKYIGLRDPSRQYLAFHGLAQEFGELLWAVPLSEDSVASPVAVPQKAFVAHYNEQDIPGQPDPYSRRSFPFLSVGFAVNTTTTTWDATSGTWDASPFNWDDVFLLQAFPQMLAGDHLGDTYKLYQTHTANGSLLASFVRFGRRPTIDGVIRGLIKRIYAFVKDLTGSGANLDVVLRLCDNAHGEPSVITAPFPYSLTQPEGTFFVSPFRRGRYVEIEFQMNNVAGVWEMAGYDWKRGEGGGER